MERGPRVKWTSEYVVTVLVCNSKKEFREYMWKNDYELENDYIWLYA